MTNPITQVAPSPIERPAPRHKRPCSLLKVLGVTVAAFAALSSNLFISPFQGASLTQQDDQKSLLELPCPPKLKTAVIFNQVAGGRGDVAAAAKTIDVLKKMCPDLKVKWLLKDAELHLYNPEEFISADSKSDIEIRSLDKQVAPPSDTVSADLLIVGPTGVPVRTDVAALERWTGTKVDGPVISFWEIAYDLKPTTEYRLRPSGNKKVRNLVMNLEPGSGIFIDRSRAEAPRSRGYCCPSYLPQIEDAKLRLDILESMGVTDGVSAPDYDRYSFNSGYAHWSESWAKYVDVVAMNEREKNVVIVLNQKGAYTFLSARQFADEILNPKRLDFLKAKGFGTVTLKSTSGTNVLQSGEERQLTVIIRSSFSPSDIKKMQLASERLLTTGDNTPAEAWASRCKLYLYEDVANTGCKWRFLKQQIDLANTISPNLSRLLDLFGHSTRRVFNETELSEADQLLSDPTLGNATVEFCDTIVQKYSFEETLRKEVQLAMRSEKPPTSESDL